MCRCRESGPVPDLRLEKVPDGLFDISTASALTRRFFIQYNMRERVHFISPTYEARG